MADVVCKAKRSQMMAGIRGKDTKPELIVRRGLHAAGYRFRLHRRDLPGNPDVVLPKHNAVIFVNGCFWHGHDCHLFKWPKTDEAFWINKIQENRKRDQSRIDDLLHLNWRVGIVWECSLRGKGRLELDSVINQISDWIQSDRCQTRVRGIEA